MHGGLSEYHECDIDGYTVATACSEIQSPKGKKARGSHESVKLEECPTKDVMFPIRGLLSPKYVRRYVPAAKRDRSEHSHTRQIHRRGCSQGVLSSMTLRGKRKRTVRRGRYRRYLPGDVDRTCTDNLCMGFDELENLAVAYLDVDVRCSSLSTGTSWTGASPTAQPSTDRSQADRPTRTSAPSVSCSEMHSVSSALSAPL